jgi:hypothetical protein
MTLHRSRMKLNPTTLLFLPGLYKRLLTTFRSPATAVTRGAAAMSTSTPSSHTENTITILGFGSLLSEGSSRLTFPDLVNFRLGRLPGYRRVFAHPASIFFQRGIADLASLQISSLSVEPVPDDNSTTGCIVAVFEVPNHDMMQDGIPSRAFLEREEEFDICPAPYHELDGTRRSGILCTCSSDETYVQRWGQERFDKQYKQYGVDTIWHWATESGLRPCAVYLRHCYLAAQAMGDLCFTSFLDETFLVDRKTTIREYIAQHPEVLETEPPESLKERYSG